MKDIIKSIDPNIIYFTHSRISYKFTGCNKTINQTFNEILINPKIINDIPLILVEFDGDKYYSTNNRRLYLFKLLNHIRI